VSFPRQEQDLNPWVMAEERGGSKSQWQQLQRRKQFIEGGSRNNGSTEADETADGIVPTMIF